MRDLQDQYGSLVTSTDNKGRSWDPAVAMVPVNLPNYSSLVGLPERLLGSLHGLSFDSVILNYIL